MLKEIEKNGNILLLIRDAVFKSVFSKEKKVLLEIIKCITGIDNTDNALTIIGYETAPKFNDGKTLKADILVLLSDKTNVNIEMNIYYNDDIIDRNLFQVTRIHNQMIEKNTRYNELKKYSTKGINLNLIPSKDKRAIKENAFCDTETGEVVSKMYYIYNINIARCKEIVYTNGIENTPNNIRWGAIFCCNKLEEIDYILGEDLLDMKTKKIFLKAIEDTSKNRKILTDEMLLDNTRWSYESDMDAATERGKEEGIEIGKEEGIIETIKNMLKENADYNFITKVTGKSTNEIKEIEMSM